MSKASKLALVADHATPDETAPAREALREAIAARDDLAARSAALAVALGAEYGGRWERRLEAQRAVKAAEAALQAAKDGQAEHMACQAIGAAGDAPESVEAARRRVTEAQDAAEVARAAEAHMLDQQKDTRFRLDLATEKAMEAAKAVLRQSPAVLCLVEEVEAIQRALFDKGMALEWLVGQNLVTAGDVPTAPVRRRPISPHELGNRMRNPLATWGGFSSDQEIPGAKPWAAALAALLANADAPLPE